MNSVRGCACKLGRVTKRWLPILALAMPQGAVNPARLTADWTGQWTTVWGAPPNGFLGAC